MTGEQTVSKAEGKEGEPAETAESAAQHLAEPWGLAQLRVPGVGTGATPRSREEYGEREWLWQCPWRRQAIPPDSDPGGLSWWPFLDSQGSQA